MCSILQNVTPVHDELSRIKFILELPEYRENMDLKSKLMDGIINGNMTPYYKVVCVDLGWEIDEELLAKMTNCNEEKLRQLDEFIVHDDISDELEPKVWLNKLNYLYSIGDKENATALATTKFEDPSLSTNQRLDAVFTLFRIAYFHGCNLQGMKSAIDKANLLINKQGGGDWTARNKLKAYEAICCLGLRDYERASSLFMDCIPTFESYELTTFEHIVSYALLSAMIVLPRSELRDKLTKSGSISQALKTDAKESNEFFESLYECRYQDFFTCLAKVEKRMQMDPLLHNHYRHYVREMRIRVYRQILAAYRSLNLKSMADIFGVSEHYLEDEVARFAAAGRIQCKIDKVAGIVVTGNYAAVEVPGDGAGIAPSLIYARGELYQSTIRCGDNLLNRVKKLSRIMDY